MRGGPAAPTPMIQTIVYRSVALRKPPLKSFFFDVTLHNPEAEPRWLILPQTLPYEGKTTPAPGEKSEVEVQIFQLGERGRLFYGVAGHLWAVKLAAGATLTLRGLRIDAWWEHIPEVTEVVAISSQELKFGDLRAEDLAAPGESLCESGDVAAPRDAGDARALKFWHPAERQQAPISFYAARRQGAWVPLRER